MQINTLFQGFPTPPALNNPPQASGNQSSIRPITKPNSTETAQNQSQQSSPTQSNATADTNEISNNPEQFENKQEKLEIEQLRARDREVRTHEAAHKATAGSFAQGGPIYEYQTGPDGKRYAVGGEVNIDTSKIPNNPEATLLKAQTIRRAANAPAQPSSQDRQVAAQASQLEAEARQEIAQQQTALQDPKRSQNKLVSNFNNESSTSNIAGNLLDIFA